MIGMIPPPFCNHIGIIWVISLELLAALMDRFSYRLLGYARPVLHSQRINLNRYQEHNHHGKTNLRSSVGRFGDFSVQLSESAGKFSRNRPFMLSKLRPRKEFSILKRSISFGVSSKASTN